MCFPCQDAPDSPLGIWNISLVAGNQVHVYVHAGLPPGFPDVHPDVIAVRSMLLLDNPLRLVQQRKYGVLFFFRHVEKAADVASRDNQDMTAAERDRKSTRLNSSHLVISYAVFCLKKKK